MKVDELKTILKNSDVDIQTFYLEEGLSKEEHTALAKHNLNMNFTSRKRHGYDGDCQYVFKVNEQYFRLDAYYSSWDGPSFDDPWDFYEVRPVEVMTTVFEKI